MAAGEPGTQDLPVHRHDVDATTTTSSLTSPLSAHSATWSSIKDQSEDIQRKLGLYKSGELPAEEIISSLLEVNEKLVEHCSSIWKLNEEDTSPLRGHFPGPSESSQQSVKPQIVTFSPAATLAMRSQVASQGSSPALNNVQTSAPSGPPLPRKPKKEGDSGSDPTASSNGQLETPGSPVPLPIDGATKEVLTFDEDSDLEAGPSGKGPAQASQHAVGNTSNVVPIIKTSYYKFSAKKNKYVLEFVVDLYDGTTNIFKYSVEKPFSAFASLNDSILGEQPSLLLKLSKLPDKALFHTNVPSKNTIRKTYLEAWLQNLLAVYENSPALTQFLSSDRYVPRQKVKRLDVVQESYLYKKAKGPGNWKLRYYVLRDNGSLDYYESENDVGSSHHGSIKLKYAVLIHDPDEVERVLESGLVPPEENSEFENAFILTEYKKAVFVNANEPVPINGNDYLLLAENKIESRHLLCAEDSDELALWVKNLSDSIGACREAPLKAKSAPKSGIPTSTSTKDLKAPSPNMSGLRGAISGPVTNAPQVVSSNDSKLKPVTLELRSGTHRAGHTSTIRGTSAFNVYDENQRALEQEMPPPLVVSDVEVEFKGGDKKDEGKKLHRLFGKKKENKQDKKMFGVKLEQAVALYHIKDGLELPIVIYRCIEYIEFRKAEEEEGLYRLSGSASQIQGFRERFDSEGDVDICGMDKYVDINAVAGLLKLYLRELPDPLLTIEYQKAFLKMIEVIDKEQRIEDLRNLLYMLPVPNYTLLKVLCAHLLRIVKRQDVNKMTLKNVGIVFSPTLGVPAGIFSLLISEYWQLFRWSGVEEERPPRFAASAEQAFDIVVSHAAYASVQPTQTETPADDHGDSMNMLPTGGDIDTTNGDGNGDINGDMDADAYDDEDGDGEAAASNAASDA